MRWRTLLAVWVAISVSSALLSYLLLGPSYAGTPALFAAATTAVFCAYVGVWWKGQTRHIRRLEDYAASLPGKDLTAPKDLPREFTMLSSALERTSQHINDTINSANLELTRRETILAGMAECVLAVDHQLRVTFCNSAFAKLFQTISPFPQGRPLYEVVREPELHEVLMRVVSDAEVVQCRLHSTAANGRRFEIHALPLGTQPLSGAIAVFHDITDIQRQEQARKDFVANVSHELRTPLAAIRGYAETLLDGALEDAEINRKFVEVIQAHAIRLNNIASDLLILSEMDSRAPGSPAVRIVLAEIINSARRTVEAAAMTGDVSIHSDLQNNCVVWGSRLTLEQVVVNLLDNAVKFNKPGGSVVIGCSSTADGFVEMSVTDTGIGIPSEDLNRIFERFYRVDKARSRQAGGTGLGLSIVKESIERMQGSLSVTSQLGRGTRFAIRLPAAD